MQKREVQLTLEGETFAGILSNTSITIHARRKIFIILVFLSISLEYFNHKKTKILISNTSITRKPKISITLIYLIFTAEFCL